MRLFRIVAALAGWGALGLQYWLMVAGQPLAVAAERTVNFFSFFTILTNILVALALTVPAVAPRSSAGRFLGGAGPRAAIAGWIFMVGAIYFLILRHLWQPSGLQWWADAALHYAMPALYLLDWFAFAPKAGLRWSDPLRWLGYPVAYSAWTLVHGAFSGWYPYPFADVAALGYAEVLINLGGMTALFLAVGLAVTALAKALARA